MDEKFQKAFDKACDLTAEINRLKTWLAQIEASEERLAEVCDTMVRVFVDTITTPEPSSIQCADLTQWESALEKTIRALMARPSLNHELTADQST